MLNQSLWHAALQGITIVIILFTVAQITSFLVCISKFSNLKDKNITFLWLLESIYSSIGHLNETYSFTIDWNMTEAQN